MSDKVPRTGRLPVSRAVLWTGIAAGVFLATEAVLHGLVLPLSLGVLADAALTFLLIVALAVVLGELTRRHHRTVFRHGGRLSAAGARRVRRHGSTMLAWLAAKAGPRWQRRVHQPYCSAGSTATRKFSQPKASKRKPTDLPTHSATQASEPRGRCHL